VVRLPTRVNLGCGTDIRPGWVNLDSAALPGVDVVHAIGDGPLPFDDASVDEVLAKDVLEHVELIPTMQELHRVLRPGGRLHVIGPHFTAAAVWVDPTHRRGFSVDTFGFFAREGGGPFARPYYFDFAFAAVERARLVFHRYRGLPWNYAVEPLVNRSPGMQRWYEGSFLARLFPAANVDVVLRR
jgi:SAM-dependent methyltransferase